MFFEKHERLNILNTQKQQCLQNGVVIAICLYGTYHKYVRASLEMAEGLGSVLHIYLDSSVALCHIHTMKEYGCTIHDCSHWTINGDLRAMSRLLAPIEHCKVWVRDVDDYCNIAVHIALFNSYIAMMPTCGHDSFILTFDPDWKHGQYKPGIAGGAVMFNRMQAHLEQVGYNAESMISAANSYCSDDIFISGTDKKTSQRGKTGYGCDEVFLTSVLANTQWVQRLNKDELIKKHFMPTRGKNARNNLNFKLVLLSILIKKITIIASVSKKNDA